MDVEKAWTLAATYLMVLGTGLIVICAMFWVIALVLLDAFAMIAAAILSPILIPIGWVVFSRTPRSRPFPILSGIIGSGRRAPTPYGPGHYGPPAPYSQPPPYQSYPAPYYPPHYWSPQYYPPQPYAPQPYAPQPYAPQPHAPQPYVPQPYAPQPYAPQQYPPHAYAPQYYPPQYYPAQPQQVAAPPAQQAPYSPPVPSAPPVRSPSPYAAYGHEVEQARGVVVETPAPPTDASHELPDGPPEGFVRADWPIDSPPPWPTEDVPWAQEGATGQEAAEAPSSVPEDGVTPEAPGSVDAGVPLRPGMAPETRADGRPPIAIHDFDWYLAGFLGATLVGAGLLAFGPEGSAVVGLLVFMCFLVAFSFPSLVWIAFVHHRRSGEPEPREGVLLALGGGMLATIPALFANTFASVFSVDIAAAVVAPIVEEFSKALVLVFVLQEVNSRYDGLIYGVTAGMGFAMMENLTYSLGALAGVEAGLARATSWGLLNLMRGLASTVGHAVGVGMVGYAVAAYIDPRRRGQFGTVVLAYLAAVGLHAGWNGSLIAAGWLDGTASLLANGAVIVLMPLFEIWILITLMRRGRVAGDEFEGGGIYHRRPPPVPAPPPYPAWQVPSPPPAWQQGPGPPPWPPPY